MRVFAVCVEEQGCPLYKKDSKLDFTPPTVAGVEGLPICSSAMEHLQRSVGKIQAGQSPGAFSKTFCGGCTAGKAWWNFEPVVKETEASLSPAAAQFILTSLGKMSLFAGVHPAKLLRIGRGSAYDLLEKELGVATSVRADIDAVRSLINTSSSAA